MNRIVVDASVAVKWVVPEDHSESACHLLKPGIGLCAPGHWLAEVSTALWAKSALRGVLSRSQADARIAWLSELDVVETPIRNLITPAASMAFDLRLTLYDTLYLAVAERIGAHVATADRTFFERAAADRRFAGLMVWVADLPAAVSG